MYSVYYDERGFRLTDEDTYALFTHYWEYRRDDTNK